MTWTGPDNFNDAAIFFAPITANQLTDITGTGQYEGCCSSTFVLFPWPPHIVPATPTNFTLQLHEGASWVTIDTWTYTPDSTPKSLGSLVPPVVSFTKATFDGIKLLSSPNGTPSSDFNFTNFNLIVKKCGDDDEHEHYRRDDDECHYVVKHVTKFDFDCVQCNDDVPPPTTPLPAAVWLLGTVLAGGAGVSRWRKRKATRAGRASA